MPGERKHQAQDGNLAAHQPSVENTVSDNDDGITQFEGERPRVGNRMATKHEASRTESKATKRHITGGREHDRSKGAWFLYNLSLTKLSIIVRLCCSGKLDMF